MGDLQGTDPLLGFFGSMKSYDLENAPIKIEISSKIKERLKMSETVDRNRARSAFTYCNS